MPAMAGGSWRRQSPWFPALVLAAGTFALSVLGLAAALTGSWGTNGSSARPGAQAQPARLLSYGGPLPSTLAAEPLRPVSAGEQADILFEPGGGPLAAPVRYFVPVAALGTGLDSLTREEVRRLLGGSLARSSELGGTSVRIRVATAGPEADQAWERSAGVVAAVTFATYAELRTAMTVDSGIVALVPLDEVRLPAVALAVEGIDLVRGKGNPASWPFTEWTTVSGVTGRGKSAASGLAERMRATLPRATAIVATGDILQSRCTLAKIEATGDWGASLRGPVGDYLAAADLALGSLDGSIQDIGAPWRCVSTTNLTSPPQVLEALTLAGIDEVTVATNHIFDCGQSFCGNRAFLRTLELLQLAGIKTVGGGKNLEEALAPAVFDVNGTRFGILGFDDVAADELEATDTEPGTAPLDDSYAEERKAGEPAFFRPAEELALTRFSERIRRLKREVDVVVVQVQTGTEDTHEPSPRSIKALRAAADAGADLVVGNQAHWVQAVETRGEAFVAYALGNFIFDQVHTPEHTQGYLLEATFWGKRLATIRLVPYQIADQYKPTFVDGPLRAKILSDVFEASKGLPAQ